MLSLVNSASRHLPRRGGTVKRILTRTPSPRMNADIAARIKRMRAEGLYVQQIAAELGINQGRVSEVMSGKRFKDAPPANDDQIPFDFG